MRFDMNDINKMLTWMMNHKHHYYIDNMDIPKSHDTYAVVQANKRFPPLKYGHYTKTGGIWTFKNETIPPKIYELLIRND